MRMRSAGQALTTTSELLMSNTVAASGRHHAGGGFGRDRWRTSLEGRFAFFTANALRGPKEFRTGESRIAR